MREKIDGERVRQLLADERAQLVEVLGRDAYEQAHLPERCTSGCRPSTSALQELDPERPGVVCGNDLF